jgi:hypothetical protein
MRPIAKLLDDSGFGFSSVAFSVGVSFGLVSSIGLRVSSVFASSTFGSSGVRAGSGAAGVSAGATTERLTFFGFSGRSSTLTPALISYV